MHRSSDRRIATFFLLVLASGGCGILLAGRRVVGAGDGVDYLDSLAWNLALAWIPFLVAIVLYDGYRRGYPTSALLALGGLWLLFLPNAPYLVTDFVHVQPASSAPLWYDAGTIAAFACVGVLLGFASLFLIQAVVRAAYGSRAAWATVIVTLALCSGGIYLGRVVRLNSWDVLVSPGRVAGVLVRPVVDPLAHVDAFAGLLVATGALIVAYLVLYSISGLSSAPTPRRTHTR